MSRRSRVMSQLALLFALGAPRPAATQGGTTTDTITGTVKGRDGPALVGAIVQATSLATHVTRRASTDAHGRFTILFPETGGQYRLIVRYFGVVPARLTAVRHAGEGRLAVSVYMNLAGVRNPIASILSGGDSLPLSAAQAVRLEEISDSLRVQRIAWSDWYIFQALDRARSVLTAYQWAQLSDALKAPESRQPASLLASAQDAAQPQRAAPWPPSAPRPPQRQGVPAPPAWSMHTGLSNVYDSNIEHSQIGPESYGVLVALGGQYRRRSSGTTIELQYDGVFRQYTNTDIWNRPGHVASLSLAQRVTPHWAVRVDGEIGINGSAEDRVLRNEYSVQPELEYRFNRSTRLQLYGEYLLKRYPNPQGQNAVDPQVGVRFRQVLGGGPSWTVTARYDYNRADSTRNRYVGRTLGVDIASPLWAGGRVSAGVRDRSRRYVSRLVDVGDTEVLRRDDGRVTTVVWGQRLATSWEIVLSYRYEVYRSNDARRGFRGRLVGLTVNRWWP